MHICVEMYGKQQTRGAKTDLCVYTNTLNEPMDSSSAVVLCFWI